MAAQKGTSLARTCARDHVAERRGRVIVDENASSDAASDGVCAGGRQVDGGLLAAVCVRVCPARPVRRCRTRNS